jgi:hypothetical protein
MPTPDKHRSASEGVDELVDALVADHAGELTVRVEMPPPDRMVVRMAKLDDVRELDELRGRASAWVGAASLTASVPIGIAVNVVTAEHPHLSNLALVLMAVFATVAVMSGAIALHTRADADRQRKKILGEDR